MKTHYEVEQELARLERLVPHIVSDQGERAEEILGFHIASLLHSTAPDEHPMIRTRTATLVQCCRAATDRGIAMDRDLSPVQSQPA